MVTHRIAVLWIFPLAKGLLHLDPQISDFGAKQKGPLLCVLPYFKAVLDSKAVVSVTTHLPNCLALKMALKRAAETRRRSILGATRADFLALAAGSLKAVARVPPEDSRWVSTPQAE